MHTKGPQFDIKDFVLIGNSLVGQVVNSVFDKESRTYIYQIRCVSLDGHYHLVTIEERFLKEWNLQEWTERFIT